MEKTYTEDKHFEATDFSTHPFAKGDYENCTFTRCDFSSTDLSGMNFSDCVFAHCNLSLVKLVKTAFIDTKFDSCKLLGLQFDHCNDFLFTAQFENCMLHLSSFSKLKMKKATFRHCVLQEVDFTETGLSGSLFDHCDLARAVFTKTVLEKADLRTSFNYSIDPEMNRIKKAKFSLPGIAGLLDKYDIQIE